MQLQLAEFAAPHPGYKPSEMHWMDGYNLQNVDTQTNPLASHQAGHNLRVLMQIDFSLYLCSGSLASLKHIFIIYFKGSQF